MRDDMDRKKIKELFIESIIFGLIFTICFYNNVTGAACVVFAIVLGIMLIRKELKNKGRLRVKSYFNIVCLILLSAIAVFSDNDFVNIAGKLIFIIVAIKWLLHIHYEVENIEFVRNIIVFLSIAFKGLTEIISPLNDYLEYIKSGKGENDVGNTDNGKKKQILLGILMAIPVLFVVTMLLSSADAVFGNMVSGIFSGLSSIGTLIKVIIFFALGFFIYYCIERTMLRKEIVLDNVEINKKNAVTGITFTTIISIVYIVFSFIQITVLFTAGESMLPEGYTYARYARQGFFQLLFVCVINVIMVIACRLMFSENKVLRIILSVISGCTYIMMASSAYRMILYVKNYDLSFLRILVLWFLVVLAVIMAGVTAFLYRETFPLFDWILYTGTVLFIVFAFARPDAVIAKYNIENFNENSDAYYLMGNLSYDAVSEIIGGSVKLENINEKEIANYCKDIVISYEREFKGDIRKFNYSRYAAYKEAKEYVRQ